MFGVHRSCPSPLVTTCPLGKPHAEAAPAEQEVKGLLPASWACVQSRSAPPPPPPPSKAGPHGRFRLEAEEHLLLPTEYGVISGLSSLSDQQAWTMRTLLLGNSRHFLIPRFRLTPLTVNTARSTNRTRVIRPALSALGGGR